MHGQHIALVGLMLLPACSPPVAISRSSEPLRLPLSIIQSNPVTTISVGDATVQAGIDTGGGAIELSEGVIHSAGGVRLAEDRTWNDAFGREYRVPQFKVPIMTIGGQEFHDIVVIQAATWPEGEGPPVPNGIGRDFLSRYFVVIDYAGLSMTLWPPDTRVAASATCGTERVPMEPTKESDLVVSEFTTPSGPIRLAWDTGATYSVLPEALAQDWRLDLMFRGQTSFYRLPSLSAAGSDFGPLEFVVLPIQPPEDFQGIIGANFFSDHIVCLDYEKREVLIR